MIQVKTFSSYINLSQVLKAGEYTGDKLYTECLKFVLPFFPTFLFLLRRILFWSWDTRYCYVIFILLGSFHVCLIFYVAMINSGVKI